MERVIFVCPPIMLVQMLQQIRPRLIHDRPTPGKVRPLSPVHLQPPWFLQ